MAQSSFRLVGRQGDRFLSFDERGCKPEMALQLFECFKYRKTLRGSGCYNRLWETRSVPDNSEATLNLTETSIGGKTSLPANRANFS
jgi:hypothetical protein